MQSLAIVLVIACVTIATEACSCLPQTFEEQFERANIVLRILVESDLQIPDPDNEFSGFYDIKVLATPKAGTFRDVSKINQSRLYTATQGSLCGVHLDKDTEYMISGYVRDGEFHTGLCNLIQRVSPSNEL